MDSFEEYHEKSRFHESNIHELYTARMAEACKEAARSAWQTRVPEGYAVVKIDAGDLVDGDELLDRLGAYIEAFEKIRPNEDYIHLLSRPDIEGRLTLRDLKSAISRLSQGGWVKIEEIPDEWKDGRALEIFSRVFDEIIGNYKFNSRGQLCDEMWSVCDDEDFDNEITHARLPTPPQEEA